MLGTEQPDRMLTGQLFGPGGNTTLEYWIDGRRIRAAWKAPKRKRPCRSRALPVDRSSSGGVFWSCLRMPSSKGRARRAVLVTAVFAAAPLAHAQQLPSIESLNHSYLACVQSAFLRRLDDFAGNLPQATERALLDCQLEEDALYTTAVASASGNTQALVLIRAAVEQLKAHLKAELLAAPPTVPKE